MPDKTFWDEREQYMDQAAEVIKIAGIAAIWHSNKMEDRAEALIDTAMVTLGELMLDSNIELLESIQDGQPLEEALKNLKDWKFIYTQVEKYREGGTE